MTCVVGVSILPCKIVCIKHNTLHTMWLFSVQERDELKSQLTAKSMEVDSTASGARRRYDAAQEQLSELGGRLVRAEVKRRKEDLKATSCAAVLCQQANRIGVSLFSSVISQVYPLQHYGSETLSYVECDNDPACRRVAGRGCSDRVGVGGRTWTG